jgi:DNA modification methylase
MNFAGSYKIFNRSSESMRELAVQSIDLAVTDPPFNIGLRFGNKTDDVSHREYVQIVGRVISEIARVLKPSGLSVLLLPEGIRKQGVTYNYPDIYSSLCTKAGLLKLYSFSYKVTEGDFSCVKLSELEKSVAEGSHSQEMRGMVFGKHTQTLKLFPSGRSYKYVQREGHPCPYPSEMVKDVLDAYFNPGSVVLDPFMGTAGLGAEVIRRCGFFFGYELDTEYFQTAKKKLEETEKLSSERRN